MEELLGLFGFIIGIFLLLFGVAIACGIVVALLYGIAFFVKVIIYELIKTLRHILLL